MSKEKHGMLWDDEWDDAYIEREILRHGGTIMIDGRKHGLGLFQHFKNYWSLLWPDDSQTWWTDLILKEILANKFTGLVGPASSWKTGTSARIALMDWSLFPECTMVIMSSTDMEGLRSRVYGETLKMWGRAKGIYDWFPGHPIDHKCVIANDDIDEDAIRDLRNGIIGVPNKTADGKVQGLGKFAGRKNTRVWAVCDETQFCLIRGSYINAKMGLVRIEDVRVGDMICNAGGFGTVTKLHRRISKELVRVVLSDGRKIVCTPNHNLFTQKGWIKACEVDQSHYCISQHEALRVLQTPNIAPSFLQSELLHEMDAHQAGIQGEGLFSRAHGEISSIYAPKTRRESRMAEEILKNGSHQQLHENGCREADCFSEAEIHWAQAGGKGRQRHRPDSSGKAIIQTSQWFDFELLHQNRKGERFGLSNGLQGGCSRAEVKARNRSGRIISQSFEAERARCQEDAILGGSWVDSVEVLKPPHFGGYGNGSGGVEVFNLTVSGHPSYSVNGLLVHNCERSFLDAQNNLSRNGPNLVPGFKMDEFGDPFLDSRGDPIPLNGYKAVFIGNPNPTRPENCLHLVCEPESGWASIPENGKTKTWDAKRVPNSVVRARVVALDSFDGPNNAYPLESPRWPELCSLKGLADYQEGSESYWTQGRGVVKLGLAGLKIITRELCDQFHAFDSLVWTGEPTTKIGGADIAYGGVGGDRCVCGWLEFGKCVDGVVRILFHPWVEVPIRINPDLIPEDQIAFFIKSQMEAAGVSPENFFFDGRGSMAVSFSRIWSPKVNALEFGGRPSDRPVGPDIMFVDPKTKQRRHKLAHEHYVRFVGELWWSARYAIESNQVRGLTLDTVMDAQPREWTKAKGDKIDIETKADMRKRTGCSPDLADLMCIQIEGARRRGFQIAKLAAINTSGKSSKPSPLDKWLEEKAEFEHSYELEHV